MLKREKVLEATHPLILKGICHRGLHNANDIENGMRAFQNAVETGMALELDVHLTKDGQLIVCHDSDLSRVTGKAGIIEDMTVQEIREQYTLLDGEPLPLLSEVLDMVKERVPIVLEMKVWNKNRKPLANAVREALKGIRDKRNILLISFDPFPLLYLKNSGFMRQLLISTVYRKTLLFRRCFEGLDLDMRFLEEKRFQSYRKKYVMNVWTVTSKEDFERVLPYVDTVTFQDTDAEYIRSRLG